MASRSTSALKKATVAGCILLLLAVSMGPLLVKADCVSACVNACELYANALCSGFDSSKCDHPLPLGTTCVTAALNLCGVSCLDGCTTGVLAGCIV
nr:unnamed protein product [Digitaria exilis]